MRNSLVFIGIISVLSLLIGCTSGITNTSEPSTAPQESPSTTEPIEQITSTPPAEASVTIDSIIIKFREVRKYGNVPDGYVYDIEAYGHASGPVGAVMWTKINTPTPIEYEDRKIQAPSWTLIEASSFQRDVGQPETTNWIAIYPGFEVEADRFDGWYNVAEFTVRVAKEQYGTILASETRTVTCLLSPSKNE